MKKVRMAKCVFRLTSTASLEQFQVADRRKFYKAAFIAVHFHIKSWPWKKINLNVSIIELERS
jgi:hypothetical protein